MRLVDVVLRQGHVSDQAIAEALMTGDRPAHLDRCDLCAERALEMGRWLETVRQAAAESADAAFPPERLAAQQTQILRKLAHLDEPAKVIAFPALGASARPERTIRRVAPGWLGVAAAAGLVVGVIGGQTSARLSAPPPVMVVAPVARPAEVIDPVPVTSERTLFDLDLEPLAPAALDPMNSITPRMISTANIVALASQSGN
jgi:hypothetical protein